MEFLWTVDQHMDALRKKAARVVTNEQEVAKKWGRKVNAFGSEKEAVDFILTRAKDRIDSAEDELRSAKDRLKKLQKKFSAAL